MDELYELLKQADVKINSTADSVQVTASNVTDLKRKADELINNLERNQKKIISKFNVRVKTHKHMHIFHPVPWAFVRYLISKETMWVHGSGG